MSANEAFVTVYVVTCAAGAAIFSLWAIYNLARAALRMDEESD